MINELSIPQVQNMLIAVGKKVVSMEDQLNEADRLIGDGDHGAGMARGFSTLIQDIKNGEFTDLSSLFKTAGNSMIASVGGSAGIIFGTFFRSGGKALTGCKVLNPEGFTQFLNEAYEAIQLRGKAKPGDKTMLDTLHYALEQAKSEREHSFDKFMQSVANAAKYGMEKTGEMVANTGRAKDFGAKSLGLMDPGAITTFIIIDEMSHYIHLISN